MKQVAPLRYGVIFKKAFCDPVVFNAFARDILGIKLNVTEVETEKTFSPTIGRVDARFDLFAQDEQNRTIVDIQHERYSDHYDRFLHYHCVAMLEQVNSAKNYRPRLRVYTIVVLTSGDKHKCDVAITDFTPKTLQGKPLNEIEHKIVYLSPKYVTEETPEPYRQWLRAIEDTLDEVVDESQYTDAVIRQVFEHIQQDEISPTERARMFDEYNEAELQGKSETRIKRKVALAMLEKGLSLEMAMEITELSEAEIYAVEEEEERDKLVKPKILQDY